MERNTSDGAWSSGGITNLTFEVDNPFEGRANTHAETFMVFWHGKLFFFDRGQRGLRNHLFERSNSYLFDPREKELEWLIVTTRKCIGDVVELLQEPMIENI